MKKNILIINDLCTYGKAALTVNIPILSYLGIEVSPLVSVILSNHTAFESFYACSLTEQLENIVKELKIRKPDFDAFYIGWISSEKQPEIIIDLIQHFKFNNIMLDPILGDNGKLYSSITDKHIDAMRKIIKYSTIATPNITELAILTDKDPKKQYSENEIVNMCIELEKMGANTIVVTSVEKYSDKIGCLSYSNGDINTIYNKKINISIPGTGDAFASTLLGFILKNKSINEALKISTDFVFQMIDEAIKDNDDIIHGIIPEKRLKLLNNYS